MLIKGLFALSNFSLKFTFPSHFKVKIKVWGIKKNFKGKLTIPCCKRFLIKKQRGYLSIKTPIFRFYNLSKFSTHVNSKKENLRHKSKIY